MNQKCWKYREQNIPKSTKYTKNKEITLCNLNRICLIYRILNKCNNWKLSKVYRYRENFINIARNFDMISNPDIGSKQFRYDIGASIFLLTIIETLYFYQKILKAIENNFTRYFYQVLSNFDSIRYCSI